MTPFRRGKSRRREAKPCQADAEQRASPLVEERLDGTLKIRFGGRYPRYQEITRAASTGGSAPRPQEFGASAADAGAAREEDPAPNEGGRAGVQPTGGRSTILYA